ncbi:PQ loop repeat [Lecanosticta acicola]|uniref:PQ loop repeat n=1 Tax=Lecanosticta acicola TaxID=111012 RepID=A0AAI8Z3I2_9PEZI|nr:PQ loop repeat [Lecanosticta acicola]
MDNSALANVFATFGAVCWSIQLIPQIVINWRRHNATGLQPTMMMFWAWAGVPLGVYNIVSGFSIALRIQPQILTVLSLITWIQCYYYEKAWSVPRSLVVVLPLAIMMAGIELALVLALRIATSRGVHWPVILMAALSALFLALGVLRHYWDIYVHRTVRGISFLFVGLDALGDLTSIISLLFQPRLDIAGLTIYSVEFALWLGIFACGGYYNLLPWLKRQYISHRRRETASAPEIVVQRGNAIAMHVGTSSTSVFRTASADNELRSRVNVNGRQTSSEECSGAVDVS